MYGAKCGMNIETNCYNESYKARSTVRENNGWPSWEHDLTKAQQNSSV